MAVYYFDSSGIVKRYVAEQGTNWVRSIVQASAGNSLLMMEISGVETVSALVNHQPALTSVLLQQALNEFRQDYRTAYQLVSVSSTLVDFAMQLAEQHRLRAYDAVQLAGIVQLHQVAMVSGQPAPILVSADRKLNQAAFAEGLLVEDPNNHP